MFERRLFAPAEVSIKFAILFSPSSEFGFMCSIVANDVAIFTIQTFVAQILIQYTLPLRSILWSLWYKNLNSGISKISSSKRPSERLMEKSHKKYGKKKLDRNILKRASEKDEEI